jgi:hypothetical protein
MAGRALIIPVNSPFRAMKSISLAFFFNRSWPLLVLAGLLIAGCARTEAPLTSQTPDKNSGKVSVQSLAEKSAADSTPQAPSSGSSQGAQSVTAAPGIPPTDSKDEGDDGATMKPLEQVNAMYRLFTIEKKRPPQSMNELVAPGYLQRLPPAPAGKKWQIDPAKKAVVLIGS